MEENIKGIKFGDNWILSSSDGMCLCVEEFGEKEYKRKDENGETIIVKSFGSKGKVYPRTLEQALNHILDKEIYNCNFSDLENIVRVVEDFRRKFEEFKYVTTINGEEINLNQN